MKRRDFIAASAALLTVPAGAALAASGKPYSRGLVEKELAAGKTVFVDFYTDWCSTCAAQQRALNDFKKANPAYEQAISFVSVDWDRHAQGKLARSLNIPRRSTLVVLKGDQELGRLVASTRRGEIQALLDTALAAATS